MVMTEYNYTVLLYAGAELTKSQYDDDEVIDDDDRVICDENEEIIRCWCTSPCTGAADIRAQMIHTLRHR